MLSSQLFWRVFFIYAGLTIGTALALVFILSGQQRDAVELQIEQRLREDAHTVATLLMAEEYSEGELTQPLQDLLNAVTSIESTRFAVFDQGGVIRWTSKNAKPYWPDADTPEIRLAHEAGFGLTRRAGPTGTQEQLYYALRNKSPTGTPFIVAAMLPVDQMLTEVSTAHYQLWGTAGTIGILALAVTYVVVSRIIGPLETLTHAAEEMSQGQFPAEVKVRSRNEIGTLAQVFNSMSRQLAARIDDLQEQRKQLEANHLRLETILASMLEGVIAVDEQECILFANPAALRLMDLKPSSMLGRPIWETVRHASFNDLVHRCLHSEEIPRIEMLVPRTQNTLAVTASRLPGEPTAGAVIVLHDVTELRRLESLRQEFVQNVSHELKTPLSSIAAYADTLLEGGLEDEGCNRQFVERIAEQADRLHSLIQDLIALARMEAADEHLEVEPIDVNPVLSTSIDDHLEVARNKRITLTSDGPSETTLGLADEDGLRTIIDNLLDNAINYTPAGGKVHVSWKQAAGRVVIQVQDTGPGIAHEHQQRIFQRFYRIDKARSREHGGTGLGLSIVKHLCQAFGGNISVQSQLGQGSLFIVELKTASVAVLK